jgi:hypothetical protein
MNHSEERREVVRVGARSFRSRCDAVLKAITNAPEPARYVLHFSVLDREQDVRDGRPEYRDLFEIAYEEEETGPANGETPSC